MRNENAAGTIGGRDGERGIMSLQSRALVLSRVGNPGRKSSYGKRLRSLEYITDTNLENTSVSADELPGSLRNLFLPDPPREGYGRD